MDERRFDELTKALVAAKPSRREALRRLAGGALATVFGGLALEEATAQVQTEARTCGQVCDKNKPCNVGLRCGQESGECIAIPSTKDRCSNDSDCNRIEECNSKDKCVNTFAGGCRECRKNGDCDGNERCKDGKCKPECRNNGDCGNNERCKDGKCVKR
jgi:hypothetical protein